MGHASENKQWSSGVEYFPITAQLFYSSYTTANCQGVQLLFINQYVVLFTTYAYIWCCATAFKQLSSHFYFHYNSCSVVPSPAPYFLVFMISHFIKKKKKSDQSDWGIQQDLSLLLAMIYRYIIQYAPIDLPNRLRQFYHQINLFNPVL